MPTTRTESKRDSKDQKSPKNNVVTDAQAPLEPQHQIYNLRQRMGNQGTHRFLESCGIQTKFKIGQPNDSYEQEANRVADQIMRIQVDPTLKEDGAPLNVQAKLKKTVPVQPLPGEILSHNKETFSDSFQWKISHRKNQSHEPSTRIDRKRILGIPSIAPESFQQNLSQIKYGGHKLPTTTRTFFENRFGSNFSSVRVHTNGAAARNADNLGARAFTMGKHIVFGRSEYAPATKKGKHLLAHELTHVIQQHQAHPGTKPQKRQNLAAREFSIVSRKNKIDHFARPGLKTGTDPIAQRASVGETLRRFFGGGNFTETELQNYLQHLDRTNSIENNYDSDNKARAVVNRWKRGDSLYILTDRRKILLIREMMSGFTGDADESRILDILRGATHAELSAIVTDIGRNALQGEFHGRERQQLDQLLNARAGASGQSSEETFDSDTVLALQRRFTSNAQLARNTRLNCILIIRALAPELFSRDPQLAESVRRALGGLRGRNLKMTEAGRVMSDLGLVSGYEGIRFNNRNGVQEPTAMTRSAWDTIMGMVGNVQGWHVFGLAPFNGYHSVTVLVDNRADGARLYWADQWAIDPGDDFEQETGSVSGFRRYERNGFDSFLTTFTRTRWNTIFSERGSRWEATLHIWKFRSRLVGQQTTQTN